MKTIAWVMVCLPFALLGLVQVWKPLPWWWGGIALGVSIGLLIIYAMCVAAGKADDRMGMQ